MSEDVSKEPLPPMRPEPPRWGPDDVDYRLGPEAPYPATVKAAGVIWIVYGCLILLNLVVALLMAFAVMSQFGGRGAEVLMGGLMCTMVVVGLIAVAFLFVGVQSVRGTARDTLGNGVGSIILALLQFGGAAYYGLQLNNVVQAAVASVGGVLLLTAGVLALVGRSTYRDWKRAQWMQQDREAAERRARRRDYPG